MRSLTDTWTLGGLKLANRVVLAPLAGIGNWFVRLQAKRYGAGLVVSEMVSSFGLVHGNERTVREFLRIHPDEHPVSMQLFGHDAAVMREAAAIAADAGADVIDLNMGCPVRKVCKTGAGAALLDDPDQAVAIARAAARGQRAAGHGEAAPRPRARRPRGRRARPAAGGRGRRGRHRLPPAPRLAAALGQRPTTCSRSELVDALPVPVIVSGGLSSDERTLPRSRTSGAAAVMLARGALGNPWLFGAPARHATRASRPRRRSSRSSNG